ncbi:hypothetical protein Emed_007239 [Eimeria media]
MDSTVGQHHALEGRRAEARWAPEPAGGRSTCRRRLHGRTEVAPDVGHLFRRLSRLAQASRGAHVRMSGSHMAGGTLSHRSGNIYFTRETEVADAYVRKEMKAHMRSRRRLHVHMQGRRRRDAGGGGAYIIICTEGGEGIGGGGVCIIVCKEGGEGMQEEEGRGGVCMIACTGGGAVRMIACTGGGGWGQTQWATPAYHEQAGQTKGGEGASLQKERGIRSGRRRLKEKGAGQRRGRQVTGVSGVRSANDGDRKGGPRQMYSR